MPVCRSTSRVLIIAIGLAVLVASSVGCGADDGSSTNRTLRFTTKNDQRSTVDLGVVGPSQHDLLTVEGQVFEDGSPTGRFDISYTTTDYDGIRERKVGTAVIEWNDGSKLMMESANDFEVGAGVPTVTEHVIVGGTDEYVGVAGVCMVDYSAGTFDWNCTLQG